MPFSGRKPSCMTRAASLETVEKSPDPLPLPRWFLRGRGRGGGSGSPFSRRVSRIGAKPSPPFAPRLQRLMRRGAKTDEALRLGEKLWETPLRTTPGREATAQNPHPHPYPPRREPSGQGRESLYMLLDTAPRSEPIGSRSFQSVMARAARFWMLLGFLTLAGAANACETCRPSVKSAVYNGDFARTSGCCSCRWGSSPPSPPASTGATRGEAGDDGPRHKAPLRPTGLRGCGPRRGAGRLPGRHSFPPDPPVP